VRKHPKIDQNGSTVFTPVHQKSGLVDNKEYASMYMYLYKPSRCKRTLVSIVVRAVANSKNKKIPSPTALLYSHRCPSGHMEAVIVDT
jgi:hypothetical protein